MQAKVDEAYATDFGDSSSRAYGIFANKFCTQVQYSDSINFQKVNVVFCSLFCLKLCLLKVKYSVPC